jgi:hypothetical protein
MNGTGSRASAWLNWAQQPREAGGLGLAPHQAAGIVGNLVNESGQDLSPWGPTGDNGTAWGTAQWRGDRLARLKAMPNYQSMETQQAFMRQELDSSENKAYRALQAAKTPEEAAHAWDALYERSDGSTRAQRMASARQLMAQFGGGDAGSDPSPGGALSFAPTENNSRKSSMPAPALSADDALGTGALNVAEKPDNVYDGLMQMAASLSSISNPEQAKALTQQMLAGRKTQGSWSHQIMPNGQLLMTNTNGQTRIVGKPGEYSRDDKFSPVMGKDDMGNPILQGTFNTNTGEYAAAGGTQPAVTVGGDPTLTGQDRYATLKPEEQRMIDGWHEGVGVNPTTISQKQPRIAKLMEAAQAVYPDMDFTKYGERQNFAKGYGNKSPIAFGGQIIGTDHTAALIGQMADEMAKLHNSSGAIGGYGATAANVFKDATGGNERANTINNLKTKADTLSAEYQTLMTRGKGGGQGEREQKSNDINQPHAAPEVQAGALQSMLDALKARHQEYVEAARTGGGDVDKKVVETIEATQKKLDNLYSLNGKKATAAPAASGGMSWDAAQKAGWK